MVVDSCVFIDHLRAKDKTTTTLFSIVENKEIFISAVTVYELYMGATTPDKIKDVNIILEPFKIIPFSNDIAKQSALIYHDLRLNNKMIEFRDIFIAATCVIHQLPLVTFNKRHFQRIKELRIISK